MKIPLVSHLLRIMTPSELYIFFGGSNNQLTCLSINTPFHWVAKKNHPKTIPCFVWKWLFHCGSEGNEASRSQPVHQKGLFRIPGLSWTDSGHPRIGLRENLQETIGILQIFQNTMVSGWNFREFSWGSIEVSTQYTFSAVERVLDEDDLKCSGGSQNMSLVSI